MHGGELLPVLHADALVDADLADGTEGDDQLGGSLQHQDIFCRHVFHNYVDVLHQHQVINKQAIKKGKENKYIFLRKREMVGAMRTKHIILMMVRIVLGKKEYSNNNFRFYLII